MKSNKSGLPLLILFLASFHAMAQSTGEKPVRAKRVFTNEDLSRLREKYGSTPDSEPPAQPKQPSNVGTELSQTNAPGTDATPTDKAYWIAKLKETESALVKAKQQETKFEGLVGKYQEKLRDAKSEFHIKTSQEQVADSLKNLSRAKDEVKQGEEAKAKLLAEAAEKGFKPADLKEEGRR